MASPGLVVLDRDGVINRDRTDFVRSPEQWVPLPGSLEAIALLTRAGYTVAVASNQSGLGRGLFDRETLEAIHRKMLGAVAAAGGRIETIAVCPHLPGEGCTCRKPESGLLRTVAAELGLSLQGAPCIGDSERDILAARSAGCRPILVLTGNGMTARTALGENAGVEVFADLHAAARALERETQSSC
ncbi:MAG: D-glycero-beta-D-manno-heptose 1,7-bisphosphate 7-phosphatase [Gammaproteobacteria bacterium]|jgi:D-glycero-D-manno-heptose 1,7-bisphosphate phosphatase